MKHFRLTPLIAALITLPALSATEELIVTGSYSPVTNEQLSSSVSVLNQEQLRQLSNHSLIDALRKFLRVAKQEALKFVHLHVWNKSPNWFLSKLGLKFFGQFS